MPKIPAMITSRVIACMRGASAKGSFSGQRVDLALGRLGDRLRVALDRLAVEGRQEQLALAHVALAERGEDRVRAEDRPQRRLGGERGRFVGLRREQRADVVGEAGDDQRVRFRRAQREDVAELASGAEDELDLALVEAQQLQQRVDVDERRPRQCLGLLRIDRPGGCSAGGADGGGSSALSVYTDRCHVLCRRALSTLIRCRRK